MKVYVFHRAHVLDDGSEDLKLIEVYSSKERAERAGDHVRGALGFRDAPTGFSIDTYVLDDALAAKSTLGRQLSGPSSSYGVM